MNFTNRSEPITASVSFPSVDRDEEFLNVAIISLTLVTLCLLSVTFALIHVVKRLHALVGAIRADSAEALLNGAAEKPPSSLKRTSRRSRAHIDTSCGISEVDEEADHRL